MMDGYVYHTKYLHNVQGNPCHSFRTNPKLSVKIDSSQAEKFAYFKSGYGKNLSVIFLSVLVED
jgi:hypothetical protein